MYCYFARKITPYMVERARAHGYVPPFIDHVFESISESGRVVADILFTDFPVPEFHFASAERYGHNWKRLSKIC